MVDLREIRQQLQAQLGALPNRHADATPYRPPGPASHRAQPALLVLRPGDKVLVTLVEDPGQADADRLATVLSESFPGVSFTVIGGISGICVQS
ncbi:hypothetical protein [Sphaerisporangium sp. TRM90804]|uniref:hypothetical protein n=1 Tax=Sphaerisporangium sp. TRM90804 TaxID=3031113 RepID=UPI002448A20B|nr:hypothetical protein [Sphaerisporangium sp. TRM90804]MDH2424750.1 hypothetical protein [Sphaerisporangium sp. TRM90804]